VTPGRGSGAAGGRTVPRSRKRSAAEGARTGYPWAADLMKTTFNFALCSLADLAIGQEATVVAVDTSAPAGRRLVDLGLLPRTPIRAVRRAPLGDPTVYELRLRKSEALRVSVRAVSARAEEGAA
jgi:ferrous iron transport protein A